MIIDLNSVELSNGLSVWSGTDDDDQYLEYPDFQSLGLSSLPKSGSQAILLDDQIIGARDHRVKPPIKNPGDTAVYSVDSENPSCYLTLGADGKSTLEAKQIYIGAGASDQVVTVNRLVQVLDIALTNAVAAGVPMDGGKVALTTLKTELTTAMIGTLFTVGAPEVKIR